MSENELVPYDDMAVSKKILAGVHRGIKIVQTNSQTHLTVVAVNRDESKNFVNKLSCRRGMPIKGYIYDAQTDSYCYNCSDFLYIGTLPYSFRLKASSDDQWDVAVPIPDKIVKSLLSTSQKQVVSNFRKHFKSPDYTIRFVQMIDPN